MKISYPLGISVSTGIGRAVKISEGKAKDGGNARDFAEAGELKGGATGGIRTPDPRFTKAVLLPTELPWHF
jgi:hypothetical protein